MTTDIHPRGSRQPAPIALGTTLGVLSGLTGAVHGALLLACRALVDQPDLDLKVHLGHRIGRDARILAALRGRLADLTTRSDHRRVAAWCADALLAAKGDAAADVVLESLHRIDDGVLRTALALQRASDPICDAPTAQALAAVITRILEPVPTGLTDESPRPTVVVEGDAADGARWLECSPDAGPPPPSSTTPEFPARPAALVFDPVPIPARLVRPIHEALDDPDSLRLFFHFVCLDIEIPAMEVCAMSILRHATMPLELTTDLARQVEDEGRHAIAMAMLLRHHGGVLGQHSYCGHVWRRFHESDELVEQLMTQQVVQEGNSLDGNAALIEAFRGAGLEREAVVLEYVNADEALHARLGNHWTLWLLGGDVHRYDAMLELVARRIGRPVPGSFPAHRTMRELAAFPEHFIARHCTSAASEPNEHDR